MNNQVINATYHTFDDHIIQPSFGQLVLVNFWMSWSKPSIELGKNLENLQENSKESFLVARVNLGNSPLLARTCQIQKLPTVIAYSDGCILDRMVGDEHPYLLHQFTRKVMIRQRGTGPLRPEQAPEAPQQTISDWFTQLLSFK